MPNPQPDISLPSSIRIQYKHAALGTAWHDFGGEIFMRPILILNTCLFLIFLSKEAAASGEAGAEAAVATGPRGGDTAQDTSLDTATESDTEQPETDARQQTDTDSDTGVDADFTNDAPEFLDDNPYPTGTKAPSTGPGPKAENPPWVEVHVETDTDTDADNEGPVYLPPAPPPPSDGTPSPDIVDTASQCAKVTCSGRGSCVIKNHEPTCACFAGFVPDSVNGLNCIPENQSAASTASRPAWTAGPIDFETYYRRFQIELGAVYTKKLAAEFHRAKSLGKWDRDFLDYAKRLSKRTQTFGTAMLCVGIPAFAGGLAMHMLYAGYPSHNGLLAGAIVLDLSGAALIGGGAALLTIGTRRIKRIEKADALLRQKRRWFSKPALSWALSPEKALLSVRLSF